MKRPWFQFYPGDWLNDPKLRMADWEMKGLWIDLMSYMHNDYHYGYLCIGDQYLDPTAIQRLLNANPKRFHRVFNSLITANVIAKDDLGFYSKRMVEDERIRRIRAVSGGRGGNPNLVNQTVNQNHKQKPTPSESESDPESESDKPIQESLLKEHGFFQSDVLNETPPKSPWFDQFWEAYPSYRKSKKKDCLAKWERLQLEKLGQFIIDSLEKWKKHPDWLNENGKYAPGPLVFINQRLWESVPEPVQVLKLSSPNWAEVKHIF